MLAEAREEIGRRVPDRDSVLDVGGWADPLERADVVLDLMPYESRGLYERMGWIPERDRGPERFSSATWITRDLCDREPWPFEDAQFDFVVCAHTLEDVRDPLWVCASCNAWPGAATSRSPRDSRSRASAWRATSWGGRTTAG